MGLFLAGYAGCPGNAIGEDVFMIDMEKTVERLQDHLKMLTKTIGERSVLLPKHLKKTLRVYRNILSGHRHTGTLRTLPLPELYGCKCGGGNLFL